MAGSTPGDIGKLDKDGYFSVTGRLKDMIIRGGENIYPKEVEDFIHHMPGVRDVQVVGVPSKKYGEQPGAFIILQPGVSDDRDGRPGLLPEQDRRSTRCPSTWPSWTEYPQTASGKIMKYKLREQSAKLWPDA